MLMKEYYSSDQHSMQKSTLSPYLTSPTTSTGIIYVVALNDYLKIKTVGKDSSTLSLTHSGTLCNSNSRDWPWRDLSPSFGGGRH